MYRGYCHDLECTHKFNPPLLSTSKEFCNEVIKKRLPVPNCGLKAPNKLVIQKETPPLPKLASSRHLKNWQKWCYIWRQTYNSLTVKRNLESHPPVMAGAENHYFKKEDKELLDRTVHTCHLNGYFIKNAFWPCSMRNKPFGTDEDIKEFLNPRYYHDYPEMKRHRYPREIRNEVSIPPRKSTIRHAFSTTPAARRRRTSHYGFNYEGQWERTKPLKKMKKELACDFVVYGNIPATPENLMIRAVPVKAEDGLPDLDKKVGKKIKKPAAEMVVPELVFTEEERDFSNAYGPASSNTVGKNKNKADYYTEQRGPILHIQSSFSVVTLQYLKHELEVEPPTPCVLDPDTSEIINGAYELDENHRFSVTPRCKDVQFIELKNVGTTAIRFQWFRHPPNKEAEKMLEDPTQYKTLRLAELEPAAAEELETEQPKNDLKLPTKNNLEFHFSELPEILLPGQTKNFTIIFRSKTPGYFHETIYLLTHPRVSTAHGKYYAVQLNGMCIDVGLEEKGNVMFNSDSLNKFLKQQLLGEEAKNLIEFTLDRSMSAAESQQPSGALPNGRITAEGTFYLHNKEFYYDRDKAEKAHEILDQLLDLLIPFKRLQQTPTCNSSIQQKYNLLISAKKKEDIKSSNLKTEEAENLLSELNDSVISLREPRVFNWPYAERRKYVSCYSTMVTTFDEIIHGFEKLNEYYDLPQIDIQPQKPSYETENLGEVEEISFGNQVTPSKNMFGETNVDRLQYPSGADVTVKTSELYIPTEQLKTEGRIQLFEDFICNGIEMMCLSIDNYNNLVDYKSSDVYNSEDNDKS